MTIKYLEELAHCVDYEDRTPIENRQIGWTWSEVGVLTYVLKDLVGRQLIMVKYHSRNYMCYEVTEKGRDVVGSRLQEGDSNVEEIASIPLPDDMFSNIVGYDDVKSLLRNILNLPKPVHVLLSGPPALAKTLFLWEIERVGGDDALWIIGSASSKSDVWDLLAERRPRWLLVDELEKMETRELTGLLSIMEGGRLVRAKTGRRLDEKLTLCVVAAANITRKLAPELLSRFAVKAMKPYDQETFIQVVSNVLVLNEGVEHSTAKNIAEKLAPLTQDVRDAIRVARLAENISVDSAITILGFGQC